MSQFVDWVSFENWPQCLIVDMWCDVLICCIVADAGIATARAFVRLFYYASVIRRFHEFTVFLGCPFVLADFFYQIISRKTW